MAETQTLARPYAKAVFQLAQQDGNYAAWSEQLNALAEVCAHEDIQALIGNPRVPDNTLLDLIATAAGDLSDDARNLLNLLADNDRLQLLPEITAQYAVLRNQAENRVDAKMISAVEPSDAQRESIKQALAKRLGREVNLTVTVDDTMLGGALIRAGDLVIDGSVKTKLERLNSRVAA